MVSILPSSALRFTLQVLVTARASLALVVLRELNHSSTDSLAKTVTCIKTALKTNKTLLISFHKPMAEQSQVLLLVWWWWKWVFGMGAKPILWPAARITCSAEYKLANAFTPIPCAFNHRHVMVNLPSVRSGRTKLPKRPHQRGVTSTILFA